MGSSNRFVAFGASVPGETHKGKGIPNQDNFLLHPASCAGFPLVMAVSDGHGDPRCVHSHIGSRLAVESACTVFSKFFECNESSETWKSSASQIRQDLLKNLVQTWTIKVRENWLRIAENKPKSTASEDSFTNKDFYFFYGATLLSVVITNTRIFYFQLGDGDIVTVSLEGEINRPIPRDPRLIANQTTSLCSPQAWNDFQVASSSLNESSPALIFLASDGYVNSFKHENGFLQVGLDLLKAIKNDGLETVKNELPGWLCETSKFGSGDDITICILYNLNYLSRDS
ncbi:protein phosphatase 2C domain-containing protein [bacterium]|nr:protein phosphatase 2C domain-containing protein [bacterium]